MGKLETVLHGFENEEVVPSLFVLMGNFCSRPCNLSFHSYSSIRYAMHSILVAKRIQILLSSSVQMVCIRFDK